MRFDKFGAQPVSRKRMKNQRRWLTFCSIFHLKSSSGSVTDYGIGPVFARDFRNNGKNIHAVLAVHADNYKAGGLLWLNVIGDGDLLMSLSGNGFSVKAVFC